MRLASFIVAADRRLLVLAVVASVLSGITGAALMAYIGRQFTASDPLDLSALILFVVLTVISLGTGLGARWLLIHLVSGRTFGLQMQLARRVIATPMPKLEKIGGPRLFAVLTEDSRAISEALLKIPLIITSVALVVGCFAYLAWLSPLAVAVLAALTVPVVLLYRRLHRRVRVLLDRFYLLRDRRYVQYEAVTSGTKELHMQPALRRRFVKDHLEATGREFRSSQEEVQVAHEIANSWSQSVYFTFILALLVLIRFEAVDTGILGAYALIALYMRSSIVQLTGIIPSWTQANVALGRIEKLDIAGDPEDGGQALLNGDVPVSGSTGTGRGTGTGCDTDNGRDTDRTVAIAMDAVCFRYDGREDGPANTGFSLGPIDFQLRSGEVVFITGGNGSGKTTLLKVLCSLYEPTRGRVLLNGEPVTSANHDQYRELISAVFADGYLFEELIGVHANADDDANRYLQELELADKVTMADGRFSTTKLSTGERRRLALLAAFLSDRPVYAFDEWAANQDPAFKRVFYRTLLPDLRRRNKLVIVISHDDRYFDAADRVIHLSEGTVSEGVSTTDS